MNHNYDATRYHNYDATRYHNSGATRLVITNDNRCYHNSGANAPGMITTLMIASGATSIISALCAWYDGDVINRIRRVALILW
jgi:hypothetical protein